MRDRNHAQSQADQAAARGDMEESGAWAAAVVAIEIAMAKLWKLIEIFTFGF